MAKKSPVAAETYPTRLKWLEARRTGIGGSDAAAVLGVSPWSSPLQVYLSKKTAPREEMSERMEWGLRHEPTIAAAFAEKTGRVLAPPAPFTLYRNPERPWLITSLDRVQMDPARKEPGVLEIKTSDLAADWEGEPPIYYQVQVQHELAVTGFAWATIAVLIRGNRLLRADVERNDVFIGELLKQEEAFWKMVQADAPPPPGPLDKEALKFMFPKDTGATIALPPEANDLLDARATLKDEIEALAAQLETVENNIKGLMGDASRGVLPGGRSVTWKAHEVSGYTVQPRTQRTLRVYEVRK